MIFLIRHCIALFSSVFFKGLFLPFWTRAPSSENYRQHHLRKTRQKSRRNEPKIKEKKGKRQKQRQRKIKRKREKKERKQKKKKEREIIIIR